MAQPSQYSTITGDCAADGSITLALVDVKRCTITNDDIAPKLTVTKVVVNLDGGTKVVTDFLLLVDGNPVTSGVENSFNAGGHTVRETEAVLLWMSEAHQFQTLEEYAAHMNCQGRHSAGRVAGHLQ